MAAEVTARCAKARAALRPIKVTIGPREGLSLRSKVLFSEALSSSVLHYAVAIWPTITVTQARHMCTAHMA
eukprot:2446019-Pyramimonas_sp.AAC.1